MTAIPYKYHLYLIKYYWDETWKYCFVPEVPVTEKLNKYHTDDETMNVKTLKTTFMPFNNKAYTALTA